jgi:L-arabinokinase
LIYVSRPQFIEEHGLIKMMIKHGLPVEMTAEEFETGLWQRSILEADRLAQEEKEGRKQFMEERAATAAALTIGCDGGGENNRLPGSTASSGGPMIRRKRSSSFNTHQFRASKARSLAESVNMAELARGGPISPHGEDEDNPPLLSPARSRRSVSISTLSSATLPSKNHSSNVKESEMMEELGRLECGDDDDDDDDRNGCVLGIGGGVSSGSGWFERRIPHNGGEVCARLLEEYMQQWDQYSSTV